MSAARDFAVSIIFVLVLVTFIAPAHACKFMREERTLQQEYDMATAVLAVRIMSKEKLREEARGAFHRYMFEVIAHYKAEVPEVWGALSDTSSCGFFAEEGDYYIFHLDEKEWQNSAISELTRKQRFLDAAAFHAAISAYQAELGLSVK